MLGSHHIASLILVFVAVAAIYFVDLRFRWIPRSRKNPDYLRVWKQGERILPPKRLRAFAWKFIVRTPWDDPNPPQPPSATEIVYRAELKLPDWHSQLHSCGSTSDLCDPLTGVVSSVLLRLSDKNVILWLQRGYCVLKAPSFLIILIRLIGWYVERIIRIRHPTNGYFFSRPPLDDVNVAAAEVDRFRTHFRAHLVSRQVSVGLVAPEIASTVIGLAMCYTQPPVEHGTRRYLLAMEPFAANLFHSWDQLISHEACHHLQDMVGGFMAKDFSMRWSPWWNLQIALLEIHAILFGSRNSLTILLLLEFSALTTVLMMAGLGICFLAALPVIILFAWLIEFLLRWLCNDPPSEPQP